MNRLALLTVSCLLSGCVILPIPTNKHTPKKYGTRGEIEPGLLRFIDPGVTTRGEVLLKLGEPDRVWGDERYFAYRWITVSGYVVAAFTDTKGNGDAGAGPMGKHRHDLVIEFDDSGRVLRHGDIKKWHTLGEPRRTGPVELQVHVRADEKVRAARLRLGPDELSLAYDDKQPSTVTVPSTQIEALRCRSKRDGSWHHERFACTLRYRGRDGKPARVRLLVHLTELPLLVDYLRVYSPQASIKG